MPRIKNLFASPALQMLLCGGLGALLNHLMLLPLYGNPLYLGATAWIYILFRHGWHWALPTALLTASPLLGQLAFYYLVFEALCLSLLLGQLRLSIGRALLLYSTVAWPLCSYIIYQRFNAAGFWFITLSPLGLILTCLLNLQVGRLLSQFTGSTSRPRPFHLHLTFWLGIFALTPLLLAAILTYLSLIGSTLDDLKNSAKTESTLTNNLLDRHFAKLQRAQQLLAEGIEEDQPDNSELYRLLRRLRENYPEFRSALLADSQGKILAGDPAYFLSGRPIDTENVLARPWFMQSIKHLKPYISEVYSGLHNDPSPTLALAHPLSDLGKPLGVLHATLDMESIAKLFKLAKLKPHQRMALYDTHSQLIYASPELKWAAMSIMPPALQTILEQTKMQADLKREHLFDQQMVMGQPVLDGRWTLVHLTDLTPVVIQISQINIALVLFLIALVALVRHTAQRIASRLTLAAETLTEFVENIDVRQLDSDKVPQLNTSVSEFSTLEQGFSRLLQRLAVEQQQVTSQRVQLNELNQQLKISNRTLEQKVTERTAALEQKARELEQLAVTDPLTGLYNRRHLQQVLDHEYAMAKRSDFAFSLIILDIDHFKRVNDTYGHPAGDAMIVSVAQLILHSAREVDTCARIGGEEFVILLPGTTLNNAQEVANRLRAEIEAQVIQFEQHALRCTVSLGVADSLSGHFNNGHQLLAGADAALYQAKQSGRNQVCLALPSAEPKTQ